MGIVYLSGTMKSPGCRRSPLKNEGDRLLHLHNLLVSDVAKFTDVDLTRDILTINSRYAHEGLSFLCKTLPAFAKNILISLEAGTFQKSTAFSCQGSRLLPKFLGGLTERLFDAHTGLIKQDACYVSLWAIQMICFFLYKYELPYTEDTEAQALASMVEVNANLPRSFPMEQFPLSEDKGKLLFVASQLADDLLSPRMGKAGYHCGLDLADINPRHGSGAVNEGGILPHGKYDFRRFDERLETVYPSSTYLVASPALERFQQARECEYRWKVLDGKLSFDKVSSHTYVAGNRSDRRRRGITRTSKTCTVPKDSRGPRVISEEDKELMFLQLGQKAKLYEFLENHKWTAGHINFTDQTINAALALEGSRTGYWATLDMKDASDRVSLALVHALLPDSVFRFLYATRSDRTMLRIGGKELIIELLKFSPMGSGVCFPIEALVFWLLSVATLMVVGGQTFKRSRDSVFVYGDDIIVPAQYAQTIIESLQWYGLKFNESKCFINGPFRESCGTDAFKGVNVTPIRLKKRIPQRLTDAESIVSWCKLANMLKTNGLNNVAEHMFSYVEKIVGPLPIGDADSAYLCRYGKLDVESLPHHRPITLRRYGPRKSFVLLKKSYNDYQARYLTAYTLKAKSYLPTESDFTEKNRYLRFVLERNEDSKRFTQRRQVRLVKRRVLLT